MTDTDTKAKAPPAWMKRDPLSREGAAAQLEAIAEARTTTGRMTSDRDIAAGLHESAVQIARAAKALRAGHNDDQACARMMDYGEARLACARATTEPHNRAAYMDDAHTFREAARFLDPR